MRQYQVKGIPLDNGSLMLGETLFHNANGYIGIRGAFEEGYPEGFDSIRGQYINGFYDIADMPQAEKLYGLIEKKQTMLNVADTQGLRLFIDGEMVSLFTGIVEESSRILDMDKGITLREWIWQSPNGKRVKILIKRMTSFALLPLFLIDYEVTPLNFSGELRFESVHKGDVKNYFNPEDPRVAGESFEHLVNISSEIKDSNSFITSHTSKSSLSVCSGVGHVIEQGAARVHGTGCSIEQGTARVQGTGHTTSQVVTRVHLVGDGEICQEMLLSGKEGEAVRLLKYTIICDSTRYGQQVQVATEKWLKKALVLDVSFLYQQQEDYLKTFWENCDVVIDGDKELNDAVHYNLYQLVQSVGKDPHSNISAKGLSGEGYEGHYFWDTEMYIQPFFTLTNREVARNLIRYRHTILEHAKENAKLLGHKQGAAYTWRTIMGEECSGFFPAGSAQYHISGDIVYSIVKYYLATKDLEIFRECGAEILIEVSRMWMDLGNYYQGQFHLNEVTGPDEYTCLVNNNYYTNVLAKYGLMWTVKCIELLKDAGVEKEIIYKTGLTKEELDQFQKASDQMLLPYDEETGINPQDDSFLKKKRWDVKLSLIPESQKPLLLHYHPMHLYRYQICKQADTVLAHFILEDMQDEETIRKSFAYYEEVTTHDSSLSTCIYSIVAAKLGLLDKAYEYFGESAKLDLFNTHRNTKDGIHTASMGGTYMAIVYGFGGLRLKDEGLFLAPVLPKQWTGYTFRFLYEDAKIQVERNRQGCFLTLLSGTPKKVYLFEELVEVCD